MAAPDRSVLAGRIQGFGNVNPPPLEEDTGSTVAKRAVSRLGDMVGEEVMLTVEDFREKGAVGAVKDAVADAGDILIDGVSGLIGWIRGDPPPEDENEKSEDATKALSNGPSGAAYGISQASPTGGINAVWVMPDEADPSALAQLANQQGGVVPQQLDPRVPKNIQPYQPAPGKGPAVQLAGPALQLPGGPMISPYQPAPSGPGARPPPFVPGPAAGLPQGRWGPGGYASAPGGAGSGSTSSAPTGAKGLVERIAKGEVLVGPDVVKRLVSQCTAAKVTSKQLGEIVCERTRRLYLGLDGGDPADADSSISRLLALTEALAQHGLELTKGAVEDIKKGVTEELLSLRSSAKHKDAAEPLLRRLGLIEKAAAVADLLGGAAAEPGKPAAAADADLLGSSAPAAAVKEADLLGGGDGAAAAPAAASNADLLGSVAASRSAPAASLDPLLAPATPAASSGSSLLSGLAGLDVSAPVPSSSLPATLGPPTTAASGPATSASMGGMPALAGLGKERKASEDAFGFVGAEMSKASGKP